MAVFGKRLQDRCVAMVEHILRVAVEPHISREASVNATFMTNPDRCACARAVNGTGFGACLWSAAPRTRSLNEELSSFKRRISIAGQWVKALHEDCGVEVR